MKKLIGTGIFILILGIFWGIERRSFLSSPLGNGLKRVEKKKDYRVVGFLPTWTVGETINYCDEINEMIFLGIEVGTDGGLIWDSQSNRLKSEAFAKLKNGFEKCGGKTILGIKMFEDEKIDIFLESEVSRQNLLKELKEQVREGEFRGVNVDFEYQSNPTAVLDDKFVGFIRELKEANLGEISLDVFANTVIKGGGETKKLLDELDYMIVMAYDFHRPGVDFAGPVAPIGSPIGERNIWEVAEKTLKNGLDSKKIVMAYPLYGYEWKTLTKNFGSEVEPGWWALASYKRMKKMTEGEEFWDEESMTPWRVYESEGEIRQIYYENLESLANKFLLVRDNNFGGVGFWALGYEGEYKDVWKTLSGMLDED